MSVLWKKGSVLPVQVAEFPSLYSFLLNLAVTHIDCASFPQHHIAHSVQRQPSVMHRHINDHDF